MMGSNRKIKIPDHRITKVVDRCILVAICRQCYKRKRFDW